MTSRLNHRHLKRQIGPITDRRKTAVFDGVPAEGQSLSSRALKPDYVIEDRGYETPCWICSKSKLRGYPRMSVNHVQMFAHRAYYEAAYGPIPSGQHIHHRCEQPDCVNPKHLEVTVHALHLAYHKQEASSLTWDDVRAIREAVREGLRQDDVRAVYGIAQPTLSDIVTGITWKDPSYTPGRLAECEVCGDEFLTVRSVQRFCGLSCRRHARYLRTKGRRHAA